VVLGTGSIEDVIPDEPMFTRIPVIVAQRAIVGFSPKEMGIWDYLDQIESAIEVAWALDTTVLPATVMRAYLPKPESSGWRFPSVGHHAHQTLPRLPQLKIQDRVVLTDPGVSRQHRPDAAFGLCLSVQFVQPDQFYLAPVCGIGKLAGKSCARKADQACAAGVVLLDPGDEISDSREPG
jgi:hypothetical protein